MSEYDEIRLGELLRLLPPAPAGLVEAAQRLPFERRGLDELVARAEADAEYRRRVLADLEGALAEAGVQPRRAFVDHLRTRLSP